LGNRTGEWRKKKGKGRRKRKGGKEIRLGGGSHFGLFAATVGGARAPVSGSHRSWLLHAPATCCTARSKIDLTCGSIHEPVSKLSKLQYLEF
jgi:hypothetical protein